MKINICTSSEFMGFGFIFEFRGISVECYIYQFNFVRFVCSNKLIFAVDSKQPLNLPCVVSVSTKLLKHLQGSFNAVQTHNKLWLSTLMKIDFDFQHSDKWNAHRLLYIWSDISRIPIKIIPRNFVYSTHKLTQFSTTNFFFASRQKSVKDDIDNEKNQQFTLATFERRVHNSS